MVLCRPTRSCRWPGTDETGSTERHAACGFSIMLERCMHAMGERECACACTCVQRQRGPCFLCRSDLATSLYRIYGTVHGPTEEDQDE